MAGSRMVEEIRARAPDRFEITIFGEERYGNYNRIQLSGVLGGFKEEAEIMLNPIEWYEQNGVRLHAGVRGDRVERARKVVVGRPSGRNGVSKSVELEEPYHKLIIATGSRPFVPTMEGTDKAGVFVFRTIEHCAAIAE